DEQARVLPAIRETVRQWRHDPRFRGAVVLASRDHNRVTIYSRFEAGATPRVLEHDDALGVPARTLDWRAYDLMWRDGNEPTTLVSLRHTPVVHFGLFTVLDDQSEALLDKVRASAPNSL